MSGRVNLLLLLSALFSALTGVGASARQPQLAQAVAQQGRIAIAVAARRIAPRPAVAPATRRDSAAAPLARIWALHAVEPPFARRRRE